ncbi:MAG: hydrogenase nickel incorporation protein HypB, partial [Rhodanobacteraceae bacterium]
MCTTCGCSDGAHATLTDMASGKTKALGMHEHDHVHAHEHGHEQGHVHPHEHAEHDHAHTHDHAHPSHDQDHNHAHEHHHDHVHGHHDHDRPHDHANAQIHARTLRATVSLEQEILARNNRLAERNRGWLEGRNILALNLVSSPGAGKTTLLERTICDLGGTIPISVVEGDQETQFDAERIHATGCKAVQINTGTGCHLEAQMLAGALRQLDPPLDSLVMIENVGNLVCPALFDLGERDKVVVLSVTEGDDKPEKYPHMFRACRLMLLN